MRRTLSLVFLVAAFVVPSAAMSASVKPPVDLKLTGAVVSKGADGKPVETPIDKEQPKPGDVIKYTIVATNDGKVPAKAFVPADKIPTGTTYVPGSAVGSAARIEFSIDGGKTWSVAPLVKIVAKDGSTTERPASPSTFTAIRWIAASPLAPKASATYAFEVRVK
jgi:uncharacterized repeat protein (TIGR01451 family)